MTVVDVNVIVPVPLFKIPCTLATLPPVTVLDVAVTVPVELLTMADAVSVLDVAVIVPVDTLCTA